MEIEHPGRGPVDVGAMPVDILMVRTGGDVGLGIGRWGRGLGPCPLSWCEKARHHQRLTVCHLKVFPFILWTLVVRDNKYFPGALRSS